MQVVRIFLLALIIIGIGLIATQRLWVPGVVSMILEHQGVQQPALVPDENAATSVQITPQIPTANPAATSSTFNITFSDYEGELDTSAGIYTDTFAQPSIPVHMSLSSSTLQSVRQEIETSGIFDEQVTPQPPSEMTNPCLSYSLKVQDGSVGKELSWDCHDTSAKREAVATFIVNFIQSSAAYKSLPTHGIPE